MLQISSATELLRFPEPKNPRVVLEQQNNRNLVYRSSANRKTRHTHFPEGLQDFKADFPTSTSRKRPILTTPFPFQQLMTKETPHPALIQTPILEQAVERVYLVNMAIRLHVDPRPSQATSQQIGPPGSVVAAMVIQALNLQA